jgi:hypothetical protein
MSHARPEYGIVIALFGVLLAVGIPSLRRGQLLVGGLCVAAAVALAAWSALAIWRERR